MSHLHHKVSALIDGELQGRARTRALAHARSCEACQRELEQTYALKQRLLGLGAAEPSADLFVTLGAVRPGFAGAGASSSWATGATRRVLVGAGSVSLAVITLAYAVGAPQEPTAQVAPPIEEFSAEFAGSTGAAGLSDPAVETIATKVHMSHSSSRSGPPNAQRVGLPLTSSGTPLARGDDPGAVHLLQRAATAPARVAYSGTRRVTWFGSAGETSVSLQIDHAPGQGTSFSVAGEPDNPAATFIAANESTNANGLGGAPVDLLVDTYDVAFAGHEIVAGRPATLISAARDGETTAKFWIDDASGMLLRREMYDGGRLVRSSDLSSLHTARRGFISHLPPELVAPPTTSLSTEYAPTLTDKGWACPQALPEDFTLTLLHRLDDRRDVMHAAYSDGLSTVSVFEEHGQLADSALAGFDEITSDGGSVWVKEGLPTAAVWQSGDTVYTVLTDALPSTTAELVAALPHQLPPSSSAASRLGRGLERIGSFADVGN
ncbi:MAG: sigma-E factor regulatory protein RseB domain-containing protein [Nocardioidaceae bacterium]